MSPVKVEVGAKVQTRSETALQNTYVFQVTVVFLEDG